LINERDAMDIRTARETDSLRMVAIAETKRVEYEGYSPRFWRKAPDSSLKQELFFERLLTSPDVIALVAQGEDTLAGFIISAITIAPPVYNPGGPVCIVDDFAVATPQEWDSIGAALLAAVEREAKARGAVLSVVVCPQRDQVKRAMRQKAGAAVASEWHVKPL
jgi:GNAT superfamily N-acetyltransferase